jgi:predicted nucleic acid-binding protein
MIYLLDTNTCIGYINRRNLSIYRKITSLSPEDVVICDVVKFELYYGDYNSSRAEENLENRLEASHFCDEYKCLNKKSGFFRSKSSTKLAFGSP